MLLEFRNIFWTNQQNRMANRKWEKYKGEWARLYEEEDWTLTEIADEYESDPTTVRKYIREEGVDTSKHYTQTRGMSLKQRLYYNSDVGGPDECWEWQRKRHTKTDHGQIKVNGSWTGAHRVSWEAHNSQGAGDKHVLHTCANPSCINPTHLYLGTHQENMDDMVQDNGQARAHYHGRTVFDSTRDVIKSRRLYYRKNITMEELSDKFDVSKTAMHQAVSGRNWSYLPIWPPYSDSVPKESEIQESIENLREADNVKKK